MLAPRPFPLSTLVLATVLMAALAGCIIVDPELARQWELQDDRHDSGWTWDADLGWHERPDGGDSAGDADAPREAGRRRPAMPAEPRTAVAEAANEATPREASADTTEPIVHSIEIIQEVDPADPPTAKPSVIAAETAPAPKEKTSDEKDPRRQLEEKRRKLELLELKLEIARLDLDDHNQQYTEESHKLRSAIEESRRKLAMFNELERPNKHAQSEVDLASARNRLRDATDELQQLEMMYEGSELEDKTSEIVLQRGRRQLELSRQRLEIQERARILLLEHELPRQERELVEKLEAAERGASAAERKTRLGELRKRLAIHELEAQLQQLVSELEELEKKTAARETGVTGREGSL